MTACGGLELGRGALEGGVSDPPPEVVLGVVGAAVVGVVVTPVVGRVVGASLAEAGAVWPPGMARATKADTAATAKTSPTAMALVSRLTRASPASRRRAARACARSGPGDHGVEAGGTAGLTRGTYDGSPYGCMNTRGVR